LSATHRFDELPPPWVAFPEIPPNELVRHLKQGLVELWVDQHWRPFWASLTREDKEGYLEYWDASPEWRETIAFHFERDPNFDAESDALESEEYLAEFRARHSAKPRSFFSRLFGKRG
jgi:hypothetical protein